jgi:hypothetical protein
MAHAYYAKVKASLHSLHTTGTWNMHQQLQRLSMPAAYLERAVFAAADKQPAITAPRHLQQR